MLLAKCKLCKRRNLLELSKETSFIIVLLRAFFDWIVELIKPRLKGFWGEKKVSFRLKLLNSKKYKVLNNVLIQTENRSSQIDHIMITNSGIFVIETKNYSGWIFGHERAYEWTQTLYKRKHKFRNPIKQCQGQIKTLKRVLSEFDSIKYYPVVVFTGDAVLKDVTSYAPVLYGNELLSYIRDYSKIKRLSDDEVERIEEKIIELNKTDRASRKLHIRKAKSY